jgi:hypothetical protein
MELESLKYIWHSLEAPAVREPDRSEVLALLRQRSRGPVARMRRNLVGELILVAVTYTPAVLFYWIDFDGRLSGIGWMMLLLIVFYGGYFYRKNRLLREMQCVTCEVRSNLERQVRTLRKYVRFYLLAGTLIIPVMAILSWLIIHWKLPSTPGSELLYRLEAPRWWTRPLFWGLLLAPVTIGIYYVNAWYVNKLYGRPIKKLQELLQEMNEE